MKHGCRACVVLLAIISGVAWGRGFLAERRFPPETLFASSGHGTLLTVQGNVLELWSEAGKLIRSCEITDPRLQGSRNSVALHGDLALLSFLEPEAGKEENRKLVLVNLQDCRVVSSFSLPGVVLGVRGSPLGWLTVSRGVGSPSYEFSLVDNDGQLLASYVFPKELAASLGSRGLPLGPAHLVTLRDHVFMVPQTTYELWAPAQKSRPARKLPVPECLYLEGQWLSGEASERELRRRMAYASEETRRIIEEFLQKGGSHRGFMAAVRGISPYRHRLAVLLRDPTVASSCRLDIWDLVLEAPLLITTFGENPCPDRFFALVSDGLWVFREDRLVKVPLAIAEEPLACPCELLRTLRGQGNTSWEKPTKP